MQQNKWRNEIKHYINTGDRLELRARLRLAARPDEYAGTDGSYLVRSLYFDNYEDCAVREKLAGVGRREKFRLRMYNGDADFIRLEKKSKLRRLCMKESSPVSAGQCAAITSGSFDSLLRSGEPLQAELYAKMNGRLLRPKAVVEYMREAYVFPAGNVRVTIDSHIRTSAHAADFLSPVLPGIPAAAAVILEVKFDEFLPDVIRDIIQLKSRHATEFSKYVVARMI